MEQITELINILKSSESLTGASEDDLRELVADLKPVLIEPDVDLIKEGEPGRFVWVLIKGELIVLSKEGEEINRISIPGEIFGEISAVSHSNATATVRSIIEVEVLAIPHQRMHRIMEKSPTLAASVLRYMAKYLGKR